MKFGGTSVADPEHILARRGGSSRAREEGKGVVAVLSARGATTDELVRMAREISPDPQPREMDMLLSTGERISCALCAMAIHDLGSEAISLSGSQAGHRHRHLAHEGAHPRRAGRPHPRGARRGQDRARRRLPGRLDRAAT